MAVYPFFSKSALNPSKRDESTAVIAVTPLLPRNEISWAMSLLYAKMVADARFWFLRNSENLVKASLRVMISGILSP